MKRWRQGERKRERDREKKEETEKQKEREGGRKRKRWRYGERLHIPTCLSETRKLGIRFGKNLQFNWAEVKVVPNALFPPFPGHIGLSFEFVTLTLYCFNNVLIMM